MGYDTNDPLQRLAMANSSLDDDTIGSDRMYSHTRRLPPVARSEEHLKVRSSTNKNMKKSKKGSKRSQDSGNNKDEQGYSSNAGHSSLDSDSDAGYNIRIRNGNPRMDVSLPAVEGKQGKRDDLDNMSTHSFSADTIATEASHNLAKKPVPPRGLPPETAQVSPLTMGMHNIDPNHLELNSIVDGMYSLESRVGQNLDRLLTENLSKMIHGGAKNNDDKPNSSRGKKRAKRMQQLQTRPVDEGDLASMASGSHLGGNDRVKTIETPRSIGSESSFGRRACTSEAKDDKGSGQIEKVAMKLFIDDIE